MPVLCQEYIFFPSLQEYKTIIEKFDIFEYINKRLVNSAKPGEEKQYILSLFDKQFLPHIGTDDSEDTRHKIRNTRYKIQDTKIQDTGYKMQHMKEKYSRS